ncbi:hypothetical protein B0T16DRAFT_338648 [Cercophora newfieldiana]|uniref:Uncharacterized protein n=1 Tax=Cercophora newfieldiana TaxID=92897 RepID=A0AA40CHH6_9PEZI|nr:hypothetical protein B0T16DRAFT_338648 [Cercophora newfieldiana]
MPATPSEIAIFDFSPENLMIRRYDNDTLKYFTDEPQPRWAKCRWISVNGLSWDVIQVIAREYRLDRLGVQYMLDTRSRTKAEMFPNHSLLILTLQKLVFMSSDEDDQSSQGSETLSSSQVQRALQWLRALLSWKRRPDNGPDIEKGEYSRTLQGYYTGSHDPRTVLLEKYSPLKREFVVLCEQVSIFIIDSNVVISFFENSAQDIEPQIIERIVTPGTVLRESCDASVLAQAIIGSVVDLAIPVEAAYRDVIGDLELDVLTGPTLEDTKSLYLVVSEISRLLNFITPIVPLVNNLRDHHSTTVNKKSAGSEQVPPTKQKESMYIASIVDRCISLTASLNQLNSSANAMIELIFNTLAAYQNRTMKQLTVATIIFLPLTFITAYFGQEFQPFDDLELGISHL